MTKQNELVYTYQIFIEQTSQDGLSVRCLQTLHV